MRLSPCLLRSLNNDKSLLERHRTSEHLTTKCAVCLYGTRVSVPAEWLNSWNSKAFFEELVTLTQNF